MTFFLVLTSYLNMWKNRKLILLAAIAIATTSAIVVSTFLEVRAEESLSKLPPLRIHSLPPSLVRWKDSKNLGDYFSEVKRTPVGYLIWSEFPVKVYIDKPTDNNARFRKWVDIIKEAVVEWNIYLPLVESEQIESADIIIKRSRPSRKPKLNPETGLFDIPRAQTAQTSYEFYLGESNPARLFHRMTVQINPDQSDRSILAATRHELGHALGIWGHSPLQTDALYFSQVRNPPPISVRDINTLKKVYQQPTRLGGEIKN